MREFARFTYVIGDTVCDAVARDRQMKKGGVLAKEDTASNGAAGAPGLHDLPERQINMHSLGKLWFTGLVVAFSDAAD